MPSPFPGMNPYLEQNYDWNEFHLNFITRMQEYLNSRVGPNYFVKAEVRLYLRERSAEERRFFGIADVRISEHRPISTSLGTTTPIAPIQLQLPAIEIEKQAYLEIRDMRKRRLITAIEMLSPTNKDSGDGREMYLAKRWRVKLIWLRSTSCAAESGRALPKYPSATITSWSVVARIGQM